MLRVRDKGETSEDGERRSVREEVNQKRVVSGKPRDRWVSMRSR